MFSNMYRGRRVLVTGHTGFKGSWLVSWLLEMGAVVAGYAVDVPSEPSGFAVLGLKKRIRHFHGDVRDRAALAAALAEFQPEVVFHLAAQALVRRSYSDPVNTFETNIIGTMNVCETVRTTPAVNALVLITSDKCYRNVEWTWGYRETDMLGGEDPYSASKGGAELVAYSYIHSYFKPVAGAAAVATARAGNVIGGGDWAADRIIPDCVRAWSRGEAVTLRSPLSTRPWQHVLEPLSGYLWLGAHLLRRNERALWQSYNFGPDATVNQSVQTLIRALAADWEAARYTIDPAGLKGHPEARLLKLCCDKALADMEWRPVMTFPETVAMTRDWYRRHQQGGDAGMDAFTAQQIASYCSKACDRGLPWTQ